MAQSTVPEVTLVVETLPFTPGEVVPYAALEELLAPLTRADSRFQSICEAVQRYFLTQQNQRVVRIPGKGLCRLHDYQRIALVRQGMEKGYRAVTRTKVEAEDIPLERLTSTHAEEVGHVRQVVLRLYQALSDERTRLQRIPVTPPPAPPPMPQRSSQSLARQEA